MEHITAYIRPPWWKLAATTAISTPNKEEAPKEHQQRLQQIPAQDLIIYTDGLNYELYDEERDALRRRVGV
jgi:hypothetical protein